MQIQGSVVGCSFMYHQKVATFTTNENKYSSLDKKLILIYFNLAQDTVLFMGDQWMNTLF